MRIDRLAGLRAADLPALKAELGSGLVALVGSPEDAAEVRRALVWAAVVGGGGVVLKEADDRVEPLWGGVAGLSETLDAAVWWLAGPPLAQIEAARAALTGEVPLASGPSAATSEGPLLEASLAELRARERKLRAEWAEVTGDVEQATMDWLRERQDAETQLQAYRRPRARAQGPTRPDLGRRAGGALSDLRPPACGPPHGRARSAPGRVGVGGAGRQLVEAPPRAAGGQA